MQLLFDFDGTIVDSFECVVAKINYFADQFHWRKIKKEDIETIRNLSSGEIIKFFNVPLLKLPFFIKKIRKSLREEMPTLQPIGNIQSVLKTLYAANIPLAILTSNSADNVDQWLRHNHMRHLFSFIQTESNYFSKKYKLFKVLTKYSLNCTEVFYIGDETHDIQAAQANNVRSIAVTWGYNSEKILSYYQPTYIARKPEDILRICGLEGPPIVEAQKC